MVDFIFFSSAFFIGLILYLILNKKIKNKKVFSPKLTSFYLGILSLFVVQRITERFLFKREFIVNVRDMPIFDMSPSSFLDYPGLWILLMLLIPAGGILLR